MDDLVTWLRIIEDLNKIVKLEKLKIAKVGFSRVIRGSCLGADDADVDGLWWKQLIKKSWKMF